MAAAALADPGAETDSTYALTHGVNPWLIAASVMLATFMEVLDTAIASVALPYIAGSLSATTDEATWVLTSYLVANAIILPASNWFSLRFGRKRFLMTCVTIFTAASFACGAAWSLPVILLARVVQGAGGGALQPLSQAILLESFPPRDNIGFGTLVVWTGAMQIVLDKGQEVDWFASTWLCWAVFAMAIALVWFIYRSWHCEFAMVNLKVLKDRNFLIGSILILLFGVGIYSTITILPLYYQELLGYTAFTAGLVVAPRGIGAICGMPVIGYLSNRLDPRWLLTFGFLTFGLTTLYFGSITLGVSPTTLLIPILITGFALSFVFVPISTAAYATLRNDQIGNASGIFNLMRHVGGSVGISIATTLLVRRAAVHQNEIINQVPQSGQAFQNSVQATRGALTHHFGAVNTLHPAQATLYSQLLRQASAWAFVDIFRWLSLLCFLCVVVVWFFKKVKPGRGPAGAH